MSCRMISPWSLGESGEYVDHAAARKSSAGQQPIDTGGADAGRAVEPEVDRSAPVYSARVNGFSRRPTCAPPVRTRGSHVGSMTTEPRYTTNSRPPPDP